MIPPSWPAPVRRVASMFLLATLATFFGLLVQGAGAAAGTTGATHAYDAVATVRDDALVSTATAEFQTLGGARPAGRASPGAADPYGSTTPSGTGVATNSVDVMAGEGSSVVSTSRSGVTRIGDDRVSVRVGERAPVTAGEHNVVVHGNQSGLSGATQAQVNAAVAGNPAAAGCTIRFLSCFGGSNGSGQALADATGQNVWAPTSRVGIPRNGPPYPVTLDRGGEWVLLRPGGG